MSISSTKDNVFSLQRSTSLNNVNEHIYSLQRSTTMSEDNAHIFILQKDDTLNSINERLFLLSRPSDIDVELSIDTERSFHWRYENPGFKEKLTTFGGSCKLDKEKSKTGWGFWNKHHESMFDIRTTDNLWARFDIYISPGKSIYVYNNYDDSKWHYRNGFRIGASSPNSSNITGTSWLQGSDIVFPNIISGFHSVLIHLKSGKSDGIAQLWIDSKENQLCDRIGNINDGNKLKDFFIAVDNDQDAFISNLIISNIELSFSDNCEIITDHWEQPILASNGELGKSELAVKRSDNYDGTYLIFKDSNDWIREYDYIEFYIKENINIKTMYIVFSGSGYDFSGKYLFASYDGTDFKEICSLNECRFSNRTMVIPNVPRYPYYKIVGGDWNGISNIIIDAVTNEPTLYLDTYRQSKYTTTFSEGLVLDGKTNYIEIPVSLTNILDWSAEFTIKTSESRSGNNIVNNPCLFGYDSPGYASKDFHIDIKNGSLYIFSGLNNIKDPVGGTIERSGNDISVCTDVNINDGELHTICVKYTVNSLRIICDHALIAEFYPQSAMSNDKLYFGCSMYQEKIFATLELYGAKIWRQGELVAEYSPSIKQVTDNKLYDLSGKNNHAILYGDPIKTVEGQVLSVDTSRHLTCSKMLGISETLVRNIATSVRRIQNSNDEYSMLDVASILKIYKQS